MYFLSLVESLTLNSYLGVCLMVDVIMATVSGVSEKIQSQTEKQSVRWGQICSFFKFLYFYWFWNTGSYIPSDP